MKSFRSIAFFMLACAMLSSMGQATSQEEWEWYLQEVVNDVFVVRNGFEYYYTPSKSDMEQQRNKGEVTYFLSSPAGLSVSKTQELINNIMASFDDVKVMSDWHMEKGSYWKDFRYEKNKFHFSIGRKTLEDIDAHFVSVTETADFYKSLSKGKKEESASTQQAPSTKRSARNRSRKAITQDVVEQHDKDILKDETTVEEEEEAQQAETKTEKDIKREAREKQEALKQEKRLAQQREKEQQRAKKEAEKQKKAEAKKQKQEEERLKREAQKQQREQERAQAEAEREKARAQKTASRDNSKYHLNDVALWLSEKYDFTQSAATRNSCTMFSTMVHDAEMAKLAIKNCLKGSNARMAVPWRVNHENHAVETGYTVDNHVLVFTIGKDEEERITLTITEISNEEFELFKQVIQQ